VSTITPFDIIRQISELVSKQRVNAAKSMWQSLPESFQRALLEFVREIVLADAAVISSCPRVRMSSDFGDFEISPEWLRDVREVVREVIK